MFGQGPGNIRPPLHMSLILFLSLSPQDEISLRSVRGEYEYLVESHQILDMLEAGPGTFLFGTDACQKGENWREARPGTQSMAIPHVVIASRYTPPSRECRLTHWISIASHRWNAADPFF